MLSIPFARQLSLVPHLWQGHSPSQMAVRIVHSQNNWIKQILTFGTAKHGLQRQQLLICIKFGYNPTHKNSKLCCDVYCLLTGWRKILSLLRCPSVIFQ